MNKWKVYKHTSPSNKVYIGITSRSTSKRWGAGTGYKTQILFYRAILKYGWSNFKHEIIEDNLDEDTAKLLEIKLINEYKDLNISYNITNGGDGIRGFKFSNASKIKMRESHLGQIVIHTDETKRKCRYNQPRQRKVIQLDINNIEIAEYNSLGEAFRITNTPTQNIWKCCNNLRNSAGGFIWKYKD